MRGRGAARSDGQRIRRQAGTPKSGSTCRTEDQTGGRTEEITAKTGGRRTTTQTAPETTLAPVTTTPATTATETEDRTTEVATAETATTTAATTTDTVRASPATTETTTPVVTAEITEAADPDKE